MKVFIAQDDQRANEVTIGLQNNKIPLIEEGALYYQADVIYLGFEGLNKDCCFKHKGKTYDFDYQKLNQNVRILTYLFNPFLFKIAKQHDITYRWLMSDETFVSQNACLTAQGLIAFVLNSHVSFLNLRVGILGYGHCAKALYHYLQGLQANVDVIVDTCYDDVSFAKSINDFNINNYDLIINTIPAHVLSKTHLKAMGNTWLIDIASFPYGIKQDNEYDINYTLLSKIPQTYFLKQTGQLMINEIEKEMFSCLN